MCGIPKVAVASCTPILPAVLLRQGIMKMLGPKCDELHFISGLVFKPLGTHSFKIEIAEITCCQDDGAFRNCYKKSKNNIVYDASLE